MNNDNGKSDGKSDDKSDASAIDNFFDEYGSSLSFVGTAAFVFAILQIIYFQLYIHSPAFYAYLNVCADLSTMLLNLAGEEVVLSGRTLVSAAGPTVTVVEGCDALRIHSVLVAVILAYQCSLKDKLIGVVAGVGIMYLLNLIRISLLLWIDVHATEWFDVFHHTILPFGLWLTAMVYFYYWGRRV
ncbi:archaeosortase/exosortase family protein [Pseudomonadales bacterium]|nr:archaeosortase/exosortase family protein [Pseudomonadales bacterium]